MIRDEAGLVAGPALVDIDRDDLEANGSPPLQVDHHIEKRVRILAARDADHDLVALFDEGRVVAEELPDSLADHAQELFRARGGGATRE